MSTIANNASLVELEALAEQVARASVRDFSSSRETYNWVASTAHDLCCRIDALDAMRVEHSIIRRIIEPAVSAQSASPFVKRIREWPRGYPGDFESIEYLCDGNNKAPAGTMSYFFEWFFLATPPVFQHRNKLQAQADRIAAACRARRQTSILVLAVGGGRDLLSVLDVIQETGARITINDIDPDALELCKTRFSSLDGLRIVPGNAFKILGDLAEKGPFDLIVCGGLFDYVPEPFLRRAVPTLVDRMLSDSGCLFFTNIAEGNPYRTWMEFFGNWKLIERSESAIRDIFRGRANAERRIDIGRDSTGLTHLVEVRSYS